MVDDADLEVNLLEFLRKSFSFERTLEVDGTPYVVFHRTETESETQFRPRLVKLRLIVPRTQVVYDLAADLLLIAPDGETPGPRRAGEALEEAAEASEFDEQGVRWRKVVLAKGQVAYAPEAVAGRLASEDGRSTFGLG